MNSLTLSQQQAIAARGNVLVTAGAGTGKTSTLVQRCMALLAEGCSLENILLVTFTEAAAVEMRGRIREALQDKVNAPENSEVQVAGSREHFEKQLALLDTALISTLHGFCLQLVREHFYELGIDPDVLVLDEQQTRPLIQQTLDALFERHYAGESAAARAVQTLVRVQGRGSDERIRALILKLHRYAQTLAAPENWLENQRAIFTRTGPDQWRAWLTESFPEWRDLWLPLLTRFAGTAAVDLAIAALRGISVQPGFEEITQAWQAIRSADDKSNWPKGSIGKVRAEIEDFFDEAEFLASLAPAKGTDPLAEDWELVRHDMLALLALARDFTAEFSRAKRDLGGVDFADLEQFALRVLRDAASGALTPAARQWQRQLQYIFVDEYQDINAAQDAILTALSREGKEANRFLVGDVKQSIYRFRLANPMIFHSYEQRWGHGEPGAQRIALTENFRSRPGILDFVNPLFRALMRESLGGVAYEDLKFGGASERATLTETESTPRVELHLIAKIESSNGSSEASGEENQDSADVADLLAAEREARLVALRLRELKQQSHEIWDKAGKRLRPVKWSDMAVLLRSPAGRVEAFAKEFAALDIPLIAARGGFFESLEVSDLVCLLKLLDNPLQDIPLLAVLRSPLVGMSAAELAEIRARETPEQRAKFFWLAARQFISRGDKQSSAGRKLEIFFDQLGRWRERVRQTSLSHCLETALTETHYEILLRAGPRGEPRAANVRRLLELAREYDPYQRQGLFRFLRFIKAQEEMEADFEAAPENRDAVRLTSIHRSKGLEFPVVVLAGIGWQFNFRELHEDILLDEQYGLCPKIAPPDGEQRYPSPPWWLARRHQRRELLGEELRLLYVALTRARDTLLLTATATGKADPKWAATEPRALSDQELLSARSYLDWLKLWLTQTTRDRDWSSDREGQSNLLRWKIYDEAHPRLVLSDETSAEKSTDAGPEIVFGPADIVEAQKRLSWKYPFAAATEQRAKTSVTELRRERAEEEADPAPFIRRNTFALATRPTRGLTAAEAGTAHHRFLERVSLASVGSVKELRGEAERLMKGKWLNQLEMESLDLAALAHFWQSDFGRKVAANAGAVQRELQFTARFTGVDLARSNLAPPARLAADEFVVVQGMVDLAVILPREIWIVDFKTDAVEDAGIVAKVKMYEPQLKLYALALARIYGRPVTDCALYFLSRHRLAPIQPDPQ